MENASVLTSLDNPALYTPPDKALKERVEVIKKWLSHKRNLYPLLVLFVAAVYRFYFLFKTKGQPLWYDEGAYLVIARTYALGTPEVEGEFLRDYFVSLLWAPFIKLGLGEFFLRFMTVSLGIATLYLLYLLVSYFFGNKTGLVAMILSAGFYEAFFWSTRLDVGTYSIFFMLLSLLFYFRGYDTQKISFYILAGVLAVFAVLAHAAGVLIVGFYAIFIPIQTKLKFATSKHFWIFLFAFLLTISPFLILNYTTTGEIYPRYQSGWLDRQQEFGTLSDGLVYATSLPRIIGMVSFVAFIVGLFLILDIFLIPDQLWKNKLSRGYSGKLAFLIWGGISFALGVQSLWFNAGGAIFEPRYIIPFYFSTFIIAAVGIVAVSEILFKNSKLISAIFIIGILSFAVYPQLQSGADLVITKTQGYYGVKQAGEWLSQNADPDAIVISYEPPQVLYYSGLRVVSFKPSLEDTIEKMHRQRPDYLLLWAGKGQAKIQELTTFAQENNFTVAGTFPVGQQPTVIVFEIPDSFYESAIAQS